MPNTIIASNPTEKRKPRKDGMKIRVSELFDDTLQGENFVGRPSCFLRLQNCTLDCSWCDTQEVWRYGNPYSTGEVLELFEQHGTIEKFKNGQHLILTGGSPMLQQKQTIELLQKIYDKYNFKPFVEIENECTRMPSEQYVQWVDRWNNSPKTENCGMATKLRYKPNVLKYLSSLNDSWFKFVIQSKHDWEEIERDFLTPGLIKQEQIVLMPEGINRDQLRAHYDITAELAIEKNVRFTDRLHVTLWNEKTGV